MKETFHEVLTAAVADLAAHGYDNPYRLAEWLKRLRIAAITTLPSDSQMDRKMQMAMETAFKRSIGKSRVTKVHPGVSRFTIQHIEPRLRPELTRRILAGADLIKLNREQAIEKTLQRFSGWASSIPAGGSRVVDKVEVKKHIGKPLQSMPYEERRLHIDQGHKLMSAIDATIAQQTGAIAAVWHDHGAHDPSYDARKEHMERNGKIYAIRGSWAIEQGLINKGDGYTDEITQPGEEVFCFPGETSIDFFHDVEKVYSRFYKGDLVTIKLADGNILNATPNHPILTKHGWVAIGALKEGDQVIKISEKSIYSAELNTDKTFTTIADLFNAMRACFPEEVRGGMSPDFHGDGTKENIHIVASTGPLRDYLMPAFFKSINKLLFAFANSLAFGICMIGECIFRFGPAAYCGMSPIKLNFPVFGNSGIKGSMGFLGKSEFVHDGLTRDTKRSSQLLRIFTGFITTSKFRKIKLNLLRSAKTGTKIDPLALMPIPNSHGSDTEFFGNLGNGEAVQAQAINVVNVNKRTWSGHVYNLQTSSGWYVANGIITHNCRCYYQYISIMRDIPERMLTAKGKRLLEEVRLKRA